MPASNTENAPAVVSLLVLVGCTATAASEELTDSNLQAKLNTRCKVVDYLALRAKLLGSKLTENLHTIEQNADLIAKWEILAANTNHAAADSFGALAAYGRALNKQQLVQIKTTTETYLKTAAILQRRVATDAALQAMAEATLATTATAIASTKNGEDNDPQTLPTTFAISLAEACRIANLHKVAGADTIQNALSKKITINQLPTAAATALQPPPTLTCTGSSNPKWASSSNVLGCSNTGSNGILGFSITTSKLKPNDERTTGYDTEDGSENGNCGKTQDVEKEAIPTDATVKQAMCKARTAIAASITKLTDLKLAELKSKPELVAALQELTGGSKLQGDALETAIRNYFGSDPEQFTKTFITEVNNKHSKYRKGDQLADGPLSEQTSGAAYTSALAHLRNERNKLMRTAMKASAAKNVNPECQNKKKSDCDKEASCEWKGSEEKGKCEAKGGEDGVKVENAGQTTNTNTTGSNSVLINKAPLWLAFLLF
uniref:Variant surface glycoprotein 1125.325 n=1 Tax=Trypanosoma brucei TaxID=5691 RepID=A0A1J0R5L4_9TRYP|nr:variant surface glycoprotein 1125.325 [Trypanosoma brucei]